MDDAERTDALAPPRDAPSHGAAAYAAALDAARCCDSGCCEPEFGALTEWLGDRETQRCR